jgi:hypothetical protein
LVVGCLTSINSRVGLDYNFGRVFLAANRQFHSVSARFEYWSLIEQAEATTATPSTTTPEPLNIRRARRWITAQVPVY